MTDNLTVFIVDDDPSVRDALGLLLAIHDHRVAVFADADSFLKAYKPHWHGCLLLDIRMPGMDGLTLQQRLLEQEVELPVVIMTGHGDVDSARSAFRAAAVDFLEKPLDEARLLAALDEAFLRQRKTADAALSRDQVQRLLDGLTHREKEVMARVVAGRHNREIAAELAISPRTVEVHKARVMDKLGVRSVAELVRLSLR